MTDTQLRDEEDERRYLAGTLELLARELDRLTGAIDSSARGIQARKEHMWVNWRDMDSAEKADFRTSVNLSVALGERAVMTKERVERLLESPYFGRVDFRAEGGPDAMEYYIGVHNFSDPDTRTR